MKGKIACTSLVVVFPTTLMLSMIATARRSNVTDTKAPNVGGGYAAETVIAKCTVNADCIGTATANYQ